MPNDNQSWPPPPSNYEGPTMPGMNGSGTPPRHGCLTAWLVFALIAHIATVLGYSLAYPIIHRGLPAITPQMAVLLAAVSLVSLVFVIALFQWRRWGFYGIAAITIVTVGLNLVIGVGVARSISGLLAIALLYWVLNMGGKNSAWRYLK